MTAQAHPPSPCVQVCAVHDDLCHGCGRTMEEIEAWFTADAAEKRAILAAVAARADQSESVRSM